MPVRASFPELPPGFRLGTATSAYQTEGSTDVDGRGPSIWDTFTSLPGSVLDATSGEPACDSYRRYRDDVALMARLGVGGHRFSISWSRVLPTGRGAVNAAGLDFYDRLVDEMLAHGVAPMAALYHWDLPQALEDEGGWLNRATVEAFAEYAGVVGERLADRVEHWIPVVEPNVATIMGHATGMHAPGREMGFDSLPVAHHLLLAHGRAVVELRAAGASSVGCANNHAPMWPVSEDPADVGATKLFDALWNGLFLEPMLLEGLPVDLAPLVEEAVPGVQPDPPAAPEPHNTSNILIFINYIKQITRDMDAQVQEVNLASQQVTQKRDNLIAIVKKRKTLEKLKEKQWLEYQKNMMQAERKFNDEVAATRHIRKM